MMATLQLVMDATTSVKLRLTIHVRTAPLPHLANVQTIEVMDLYMVVSQTLIEMTGISRLVMGEMIHAKQNSIGNAQVGTLQQQTLV